MGYCIAEPATGVPRFWAAAWTPSRRPRTLRTSLRHIDRLYLHTDAVWGVGALDRAIGARNHRLFHEMLVSHHASITLQGISSTTVQAWSAVRKFALDQAKRLMLERDEWLTIFHSLNTWEPMTASTGRRLHYSRALPALVQQDLLEVAEPLSPRNPFIERNRLRNWLIVRLLLECGLRRGEALLLLMDSLCIDIDPAGRTVRWLNVTDTADPGDTRISKPGIKTLDSHRQVPVSADLALVLERYVSDDRVDGETARLITSNTGTALSESAADDVLSTLTSALKPEVIELFRKKTGKKSISPHDLRHTCATNFHDRLSQQPGAEESSTFAKMREFFGWAADSPEPKRYARASIRTSLQRTFTETFDEHLKRTRAWKPNREGLDA